MKNIFLFFLALTVLKANGQNHFFGVKGGISWTNLKANNFFGDRKNRTALATGLTYDYIFKKHFSLGADIIYNQRGFSSDVIFTDILGNPTGEKETVKNNYDYVTLPLKVGFNFGKTFYGFINFDLTPSILVNGKDIYPTIKGISRIKINSTNRVNRFDFGELLEVGGGYKFKR